MTTVEFLTELRNRGIELWVEGERLRFRAPKGALDQGLRTELGKRKPDIIRFLKLAGVSGSEQRPPILPVSRDQPLPLSFAQARLWLIHRWEPGNPAYNIPVVLRLAGQVDAALMERSINAMFARHESLRTAFRERETEPVQVVEPRLTTNLPVVDLSLLDDSDRETKLWKIAGQEARRAFHLERAPLLRLTLVAAGDRLQYLLFTMHHIISDAWSMQIFIRETGQLYESYLQGRALVLPHLPIQYADYAIWQKNWIRASVRERQLAYWRRQLAGIPGRLSLPARDRFTEANPSLGMKLARVLPPNLTATIKALTRETGCTLFMTLLGVFNLLLSRLSGQEDIAVGAPMANRNQNETSGVIGFFVNTLVFRTDLSGNPSFRNLLQRTKQMTLDAFTHQDLPFEEIVSELAPNRGPGENPLFQVMFNLVHFTDIQVGLPGLKMRALSSPETASKFELMLDASEQVEGIKLVLVYQPDRFSREIIAEIRGQLEYLLEQVTADPDRSIGQYTLVTPSAGKKFPDPFLEQPAHWPGSICQRISQNAGRFPQKKVLVYGEEVWRFAELENFAVGLASALKQAGLGRGDFVAVYGNREPILLGTLLGIMRAGAGFLILDKAYPTARLTAYLDRVQPKAWVGLGQDRPPAGLEAHLVSMALALKLELPGGKLLGKGHPLTGFQALNEAVEIQPDDPAYILFTSGSTGTAKAVLGSHGPLCHFLDWHCRQFDLGEMDRFALLSGLAHDPALRDLFTAPWVGAALHIPESGLFEAPGKMAKWLVRSEITVAHLTPSMGQFIAGNGHGPEAVTERPASLRYLFFGGEVLRRDDLRLHATWLTDCKFVNFYGATETPQAMAWHACEDPTTDSPHAPGEETLPIGRGIDGVQILILNQQLTPCGIGESGEICVRTPYLSKGYLSEPDLTEARFIPNPFTHREDDLLYRTGDLGCYLEDGSVLFLGRSDNQVKIRGYRVNLEEIEVALAGHPAVAEAAVSAHLAGPTTEPMLRAYVVAHPEYQAQTSGMDFGLFYFAADQGWQDAKKYELYTEGAKWADRAGFQSVWTPERHFHEVAGLYPNPSVLNAALAMVTERIRLRAGSVVLPLHHPIRVAEDWSVVDNLSNGRVGLSFTSGWVPNDFAFNPGNYAAKREIMFDGIEKVRRLWRGETIETPDGLGQPMNAAIFPRPIQSELPVWLTCTGGPEMFLRAGEHGFRVLTALLVQTIEEAETKIAAYRETYARHGHDPADAYVTMMLHAFVGPEQDRVLELVREPFCQYMKSHIGLVKTMVKSLDIQADLSSEAELEELVDYAFDRYRENASLLGTPESCLKMVKRLKRAGVDEIACLIDFGVDTGTVLDHLQYLEQLRDMSRGVQIPPDTVLDRHLRATLPPYMTPHSITTLPALPKTPTGKLDRGALPADNPAPEQAGPAFVAPRIPIEKELAEILKQTLNLERVGIYDNFFQIGGSSLLAIKFLSGIRREFEVELTLRNLLETPHIAGLAVAIIQNEAEDTDDEELHQILAEVERA